jgi:hypothetical protein
VRRLRIRKNSWIIAPVLVLSLFSSPVKAETFETNGANDFFFTLESGTTFTIRTFAQSRGIDSMLWLYDSNNQVLVANDDHFGLDSYISYPVQNTGIYRIRTGVCCGDPNRWYGSTYTFESSSVPTNAPETTTTTSSTTTTTVAPYLNPPIDLRVSSVNESKVYLEWDPPLQSNTQVERYAIFWSCDSWSTGFAISSTVTTAIVENLDSGATCEFRVRADNDSLSIYSFFSETVSGTTTATTTTTSTTTSTSTTTTSTTTSTTTTIPETTTTSVFISPFTTTTISAPTTTVTQTTTVPPTTTLPPVTTTTPPVTTTTTTQPPQGIDEEVTELLNNTEELSQEEIVSAIENIINDGVSSEEAASIATNSAILEAISAEDAKEIFQEISISELTAAQQDALVEALTNAPEDVKETFEQEIDIFGEGLDDYVPTGSQIDVEARRALIAVTTVLTTITTAPMPSGGSSAPSGGGAGGGPSGGGGSGNTDRGGSRSRRK